MKLEISTDEVLEMASKSNDAKAVLSKMFPECFSENLMSDDKGKDAVPIKDGDKCYIVHGTPESYTITFTTYPRASHGAIKIFKGDVGGKINAELFVIENTKRFTLKDIDYALRYWKLEEHSGGIVSRLNDKHHPDECIKHKECML